MQVPEDQEGNPSSSANNHEVFDAIYERSSAGGVPFGHHTRVLATGQAVEVEVPLIVVGRTEIPSLL